LVSLLLFVIDEQARQLAAAERQHDVMLTQLRSDARHIARLEERRPDIDKLKFMNEVFMTRDATLYRIAETVYARAPKYAISPYLVLAVISRESNFVRTAISTVVDRDTGELRPCAYGLMQINFDVWRRELKLDAERILEIEYNIEHGLIILRRYLDKHNGDIAAALFSYYGGTDSTPYVYPVRVLESKYFK
jgi:soluble lytic murein transglycosylase-like protein